MQALAGRDALLTTLVILVALLFVVTVGFSAYAVTLRLWHRSRDRRRARFAERWREGLLATIAQSDTDAAGTDVSRDVRGDVAEDERIHFVGFVVEYARRLSGDGRDTLRGLVEPYLGLIAERADSSSVEVRARAIQTLGMLGLEAHAPRVIAALDDDSPLVAMVAARALAQAESPTHAAAVLERLPRFQGWNRRFLASMLAAMGPEVAATFRAGLADSSREPRTRAVLAEALLLQSDLLAADVAARILEADADRELRVAALRLLHVVGRPDHAPVVRRYLGSDDETVRAQALRALGAVGSQGDVPTLLDAMMDASPWVALSAARAALEAGAQRALDEIATSEHVNAALARQVLAEERAAA